MVRPLHRLTVRTVQNLKTPGRHADGGGLYLHVDPTGAKRWVLVYQWQGRRREMGLGSTALFGLAEAREAAISGRRLVARGIDPIDSRKAERLAAADAVTFGEVADQLVGDLKAGWRNAKHTYQWEVSLKEHAAGFRAKPINEVTTADVLTALQRIWTTIPETASRTRGRIERVLDAAKARGLREGENPARWRGHLDHLLPARGRAGRAHHPALPYGQIRAMVGRLRERAATAAQALEFLILTAARTGEVTGATWGEIDLAHKIWTVPKGRMKAGLEHRVPLSARATEILTAARELIGEPSPEAFLFPSPQGGELSNMAMRALMKRMELDAYSVHGFRSTFRDWVGEETSFPREIAEAALAHRVGDEVELSYRRGDALAKRRRLMDAWAKYCGG